MTWHLQQVMFEDGATATGFFNYNPSTGQCSDLEVTIEGPLYEGSYTFRSGGDRVTCTPTKVDVCQGSCPGGSKYFALHFEQPLTTSNQYNGVVQGRPEPETTSYYGVGWFSSAQGVSEGYAKSKSGSAPVFWTSSGGQDPNHSGNPKFMLTLQNGASVEIDLISSSLIPIYSYVQPMVTLSRGMMMVVHVRRRIKQYLSAVLIKLLQRHMHRVKAAWGASWSAMDNSVLIKTSIDV